LDMSRTLVFLSLIAVYFGEASISSADTPTTTPPPGFTSSTPACGDLCKGLVGGAAGLAGLGAIGGIVAATMPKNSKATVAPTVAPGKPTVAPTVAPTATLVVTTPAPVVPTAAITTAAVRARAEAGSSDSSGSGSSGGWLLPLLLGLLALCCLAALLGYFCMQKPKKASKRATKVKKPTPAPAPVVHPHAEPEAAPLMSGHYEQPMMTVPVGTTTPSYMPTVVETVAPVASYMPTVAPTYGMAPTVMESYLPTVAPTYAASPMYGTSQIV